MLLWYRLLPILTRYVSGSWTPQMCESTVSNSRESYKGLRDFSLASSIVGGISIRLGLNKHSTMSHGSESTTG